MARPGNVEIQLDLFLDYANNVKLYPAFHEYYRKWTPRCSPYQTRAAHDGPVADNFRKRTTLGSKV
jgi:hypothetical protein